MARIILEKKSNSVIPAPVEILLSTRPLGKDNLPAIQKIRAIDPDLSALTDSEIDEIYRKNQLSAFHRSTKPQSLAKCRDQN